MLLQKVGGIHFLLRLPRLDPVSDIEISLVSLITVIDILQCLCTVLWFVVPGSSHDVRMGD